MLSSIDYLKFGELNNKFYDILTLFAHHLQNNY